MTQLDEDLELRFGARDALEPPVRRLMVFDLNELEPDGFPDSLLVTYQGLTWVLVFTAVDDPLLLQCEAHSYAFGDKLKMSIMSIEPLPTDTEPT